MEEMKYTEKTIQTEHGTITIHRPILSDSERKKREQEVIAALIRFGKEIEKGKIKL
jgi:hypothetical protein